MELNNDFEVSAPIDKAWAVLTDVERIAHSVRVPVRDIDELRIVQRHKHGQSDGVSHVDGVCICDVLRVAFRFCVRVCDPYELRVGDGVALIERFGVGLRLDLALAVKHRGGLGERERD